MLRNEKGVAIVFFALMLVITLGMGALVTDLSLAHSNRTRIKNALDFASLAGISQLTNPASVSNAKQTALDYLNNNLSMTLSSFTPLSLSSNGLSIQAGIYDFNNMTFTFDEANSNINALMISYNYNSPTFFSDIFMINSASISESTTASKQIAAYASPGGAFPLIIYSTSLANIMNNVLDLVVYSAAQMDNSYWTDYTSSNPSTTDVNNILDYFQYGMGTAPPGITLNDTFNVNDGGMGGIFMNLDVNALAGMTLLFSIVSPTLMSGEVMADGFLGGTINSVTDSMGQKSISLTVIPGYIDNSFGGLQIDSGMTNVNPGDESYLAKAFGLVQ